MNPSIIVIVVLALLLAYFILVVVTSKQSVEVHKRYKRKADVNKKTVMDFYDGVYNHKNTDLAMDYLDANIIQHDPAMDTGRPAFLEYTKIMHKQRPDRRVEIKQLIADDISVVLYGQEFNNPSDSADPGNALMEIFKLQDGKIIEHWKVAQPVPEKPANKNTMF